MRHNGEEAREYLEHQSDGYWKNEHMIQQVNKTINIFERKYPNAIALFIYDNAPLHMNKPVNALNADAMKEVGNSQ